MGGWGVREVEVVGIVEKEQRAEKGLHHWLCCFYPGNVICLNALCSPGARPAAALIFLRLGCQSEPGLPVGKQAPLQGSRPHPGDLDCALLRFIGGPIPLRRCVWLGSTVSQAE